MLNRSIHSILKPSVFVPGISSGVPIAPIVEETFYKRPLPKNLVSFSSKEGKILFKEAMIDGYMENYFSLGE
jgi:hypothetical protein